MPHALSRAAPPQEDGRPGPRWTRLAAFALVTQDLPRLARFYAEVLGFTPQGPPRPIAGAEMKVLGLSGGGMRQVLSLGNQTLWIDRYEEPGSLYPADADAASLIFQHLALVVDDMGGAYARVRACTPISAGGPQKLPPASGGVEAYKFRDPDGHPLELLQFPKDGGPEIWRRAAILEGQIGPGVDHSAISVADAEASSAFYQARGLTPGGSTRNQGPAQDHLDGLLDVRASVVPLHPESRTPHLELLGYARAAVRVRPDLKSNDVAATRLVWPAAVPELTADPDGHLHQTLMVEHLQ